MKPQHMAGLLLMCLPYTLFAGMLLVDLAYRSSPDVVVGVALALLSIAAAAVFGFALTRE